VPTTIVIKISVVNSPDSRNASFRFQTFDESGRMIGNSTTPYIISAIPLALASTLSKSNSQVSNPFRLTVNAKLQIGLTTSNFIQVLLPQATYNLPNIACYSSGIKIGCNPVIDNGSGQLMISMAPPCSQCSVNSSITFDIDGLTNPTFINNST